MIVWASAAVSLDGYIDDTTSRRLVLSGTKDWEQVRALRAECDAVLVGAETIRKDNPALVTRSEKLREKRTAQGKPADPVFHRRDRPKDRNRRNGSITGTFGSITARRHGNRG